MIVICSSKNTPFEITIDECIKIREFDIVALD